MTELKKKGAPNPRATFTPKQEAFIRWYVSAEVAFNATEAARRAGYKGNAVTLGAVGAENLKKPQIHQEIDRRLAVAFAGADVTVENVLEELRVIQERALAAEQYAPAARCAELKGRFLKMFTDRIETVRDVEEMSTAELERLLVEVVEAGGIDLRRLFASNGSGDGSRADSPNPTKPH